MTIHKMLTKIGHEGAWLLNTKFLSRVISLNSNGIDRHQYPSSHPRAWRVCLRIFPCLRGFQILRPEWPSSTLLRTIFVQPATRHPRIAFAIQKNTVVSKRGLSLGQRPRAVHFASEAAMKIPHAHVKTLGHGFTFFRGESDNSWRASAAIATLRTREPQSPGVPLGVS